MQELSPAPVADATGVALWRRFMAMVYDTVALVGVLFGAAAVVVFARHGQAIPPGDLRFTAYLVLVIYAYFALSWRYGGQTLGMKAWKFRVLDTVSLRTVSWPQTLLRFLIACVSWAACGLGFLWALVDPERRTWHDRVSATRLVPAPPRD